MSDTYEEKVNSRLPTKGVPSNEYPHERVWQMAGGVRVVVGNEQGKETLKIFHPSGTYTEIWPDGSKTEMTIGENKQYNKSGTTLTIDNNGDVHYHGHGKVTMGGGAHVEVQGDAGVVIGGKTAMVALGDLGLSVNGNMLLTAKGNMSMNTMGKLDVQAQGTAYIGAGGNMTIQASQLDLNPGDGKSGYNT